MGPKYNHKSSYKTEAKGDLRTEEVGDVGIMQGRVHRTRNVGGLQDLEKPLEKVWPSQHLGVSQVKLISDF